MRGASSKIPFESISASARMLWASLSASSVFAAKPISSVGRVGEAREVAEAYLYLMREGFSTGQVVIVDGGAALV
jgi:NAD(P)-dependent dehydrogenase (short-subunit alcohol dehydrogenase family)